MPDTTVVQSMIDEAVQYNEELSKHRRDSTDYYMGRPFGDEEEGRSQVVLTDLRDAVQSILPSLMRIFFAPEHVVEFRPARQEDIPLAKQRTDYIRYLVTEENDGFLALYSAFKDALLRKLGVIKYWYDETTRPEGHAVSGLDDMARNVLRGDPEVEITDEHQDDSGLWEIEFTRTPTAGRIRFAPVPPEEFIFSRDAVDRVHCTLMGHKRLMRRDDLLQMGFEADLLDESIAVETALNQEAQNRKPNQQTTPTTTDEAAREYEFVEAYIYLDGDDDGVAELRLVQTLGASRQPLNGEYGDPASERPFALFSMDPEPHTLIGLDLYDYLQQDQRINSAILRGVLDSLVQTLHNRMEVVEDEVNMLDVLTPKMGAPIRVRKPGMIRELGHTFVGREALPIFEYMQHRKEDKIGISRAAVGLDPQTLQSATRAAVSATISKAQERVELIARIFAEGGMKQLYGGLQRLVAAHQDQAKVVRLRNEWVEVDPRTWHAMYDLTINVVLGAGTTDERIAMLGKVAEKQEALLSKFGPSNPLVTMAQYRNTMARILELAGWKDADRFFKPVNEQQLEMMAAKAATSRPPTPEELLQQANREQIQAEIEMKKADIAIKQRELALKEAEAIAKDDRERDRLDADAMLRAAEIEAKYQSQVDVMAIKAAIEQQRRPLLVGAPNG